MIDLKKHVEGNVNFSFYRAGYLWYKTDSGLEFCVPVSEADDNSATFMAQDKAIYYMRWIRRYLEQKEIAEKL